MQFDRLPIKRYIFYDWDIQELDFRYLIESVAFQIADFKLRVLEFKVKAIFQKAVIMI